MQKKLLLWGCGILLLICTLAFWFLSKTPEPQKEQLPTKGIELQDPRASTTLQTVFWDPNTGLLSVRTDSQKEFIIRITVPETTLTIFNNKPGKPLNEILIFTRENNQGWITAFCPGDTVQIFDDSVNISTMDLSIPITVKEIRNRGDRACAW